MDERVCVACGAVEPRGGMRLTDHYEWVCRRAIACAARIAAKLEHHW